MRKWTSLVMALLLVGAHTSVWAKKNVSNTPLVNPMPMDFAYGRSLEIDSSQPEQALVSLRLPASIVDQMVFSDLRDLRVFSSDQRSLPMTILKGGKTYHYHVNVTHTLTPVALNDNFLMLPNNQLVDLDKLLANEAKRGYISAFYSAKEQRMVSGKLMELAFQREVSRKDNSYISLFSKKPQANNWIARGSFAQSFVPDAKAQGLTSLQRYSLQQMQDDDWLVVTSSELLTTSDLPLTTYMVDQRTFPEAPVEYVPLTSVDEVKPGYEAIYSVSEHGSAVQNIVLNLDQPMVLSLKVQASSSLRPDQWYSLGEIVLDTRANPKGQMLAITAANIQRIRLEATKGAWPAQPPSISREFYPPLVIFNRLGQAPYLMAWGAKNVSDGSMSILELLCQECEQDISKLPITQARFGADVKLGGVKALPKVEQPFVEQSSRWLLWGLMGLGALVLLMITVKLVREALQQSE